jgi:hypothetical protein
MVWPSVLSIVHICRFTMADPISILGITGTVISLCARTAKNANALWNTYDEAAGTLRGVSRECSTLEASVKRVQQWAQASDTDLADLKKSLEDFLPCMHALDNEVQRLLGGTTPADAVTMRSRLRYMWNESKMRGHLDDMRWMASHIHFLVTAANL